MPHSSLLWPPSQASITGFFWEVSLSQAGCDPLLAPGPHVGSWLYQFSALCWQLKGQAHLPTAPQEARGWHGAQLS